MLSSRTTRSLKMSPLLTWEEVSTQYFRVQKKGAWDMTRLSNCGYAKRNENCYSVNNLELAICTHCARCNQMYVLIIS